MTDSIKSPRQPVAYTNSLIRYGLAASALGSVSFAANADEFPYAPIGGLPVIVDAVNDRFDIDINNDDEADFVIFHETEYGGGFAIHGYYGNLAFGQNKIRGNQYNLDPFRQGEWVKRYDAGEAVSVGPAAEDNALFFSGNEFQGNSSMHIDVPAGPNNRKKVQPFRGKPGFIGLVLGPTSGDDNYSIRPAWLEVVVSPDGSQLKILAGVYESEIYTYDILLPLENTPPPALAGLAAGAE